MLKASIILSRLYKYEWFKMMVNGIKATNVSFPYNCYCTRKLRYATNDAFSFSIVIPCTFFFTRTIGIRFSNSLGKREPDGL